MRILVFLLWAGFLLWGQPNQYVGLRRYPTPGVKATSITVDRAGFPWIAGPHGTFRFDGVRLTPAREFGLPTRSGDQLAVTPDGAIWALSGGQLWRMDRGRFRQLSADSQWSSLTAAGELLYTAGRDLVVWRGDTALRLAPGPAKGRIRGDAEGRVWFGAAGAAQWIRWTVQGIETGQEPLPSGLWPEEVAVVASDQLAILAQGSLHSLRRQGKQWLPSTKPTPAILSSNPGETLSFHCAQLRWLTNPRTPVFTRPAIEVRGLGLDPSGGVWATDTTEEVALLSSRASIHIPYGYESRSNAIHDVMLLGDRTILATAQGLIDLNGAPPSPVTTCDGAVFYSVAPRFLPHAPPGGAYLAVLPETDGTFWAVQHHKNVVKLDPSGRVLAEAMVSPNVGDDMQFVRNIWDLAHSPDGRLWAASKDNLIEVIKGPKPHYRLLSPTPRYFAKFVWDLQNRLYAVSEGAILRYDSGQWREIPAPPCTLSPLIRTIAIPSDNEYWIGYRNRDGFTYASRSNAKQAWSCEHFGPDNGFPGDTQFLSFDKKGRLWRGSEVGLSIASHALRQPPKLPADWHSNSRNLGIGAGDMGQVFVETPNGSVLVVSKQHLYAIPPEALAEDPGVPPQLSLLRRSDVVVQPIPGQPLRWKQGEPARLELSALPEAAQLAPPAIEYSFDNRTWSTAQHHEIPLAGVTGRSSTLQLRYAGSARILSWPVLVEVAWWQTNFARVGFAVGILLAGWRQWPILGHWSYQWKKSQFFRRRSQWERHNLNAASKPWPPGDVVRGRYRIISLLESGGFSDVYRARQDAAPQQVVIKRLRPLLAQSPDSESWLRRRFTQELAAVSLIRHHGVLPILDSWVDGEGLPHLVMEWVDGPTLRQLLTDRAPLPPLEAITILTRLAETLSAAHAQGVVHCDLKPENILLRPLPPDGWQPIIIDFGASVLHLQRDDLARISRPAGSFLYMAPEQMLGRSSSASDVYSLAVIALEMLANLRYADLELPMDEQWQNTLLECFRRSGIPAGSVFAKALRYDPYQRESDIAAWVAQLRAAFETRS